MNRRYRVRDLLSRLYALGGTALRMRGSHKIVGLPSGRTVSVPANHLGHEVSAVVLASVRRALRADGLEL